MKTETSPTYKPERLSRLLFNVAWPVVALNLLQVVNSLLDRFFIGHLPEEAMAAHGASMSIIFLLFSLAMSISIGTGAIVARHFGAREVSEYKMAAQQSVQIAVYVGFGLALLGVLLTPLLARFILPAEDKASIGYLTVFLQMYSLGVPAICIIQVLAASLRSIGDTKSPMFLSGAQILIHVLLNYAFIFPKIGPFSGLGLGLQGAGLALSSSAWISAIAYLLYIRRTPIGARFSTNLPKRDWLQRVLRIAVPSAFQAALRTFSLTAFTLILGYVPNHKAALSAMGTGFAIESLMFAPAFGISAAAGALVGQNLGAKNPGQAERIGWLASMAAFTIALVICGPIYFSVPYFAGNLVGHKPEITAELVSIVQWLCVTEPLFCLAMVLIGAMQGAGDTKRPLWIGIFSLWFLRVPLAILFALPIGMALGAKGAWIAMSITQGLQGILSAFAWKKGQWKTVKV